MSDSESNNDSIIDDTSPLPPATSESDQYPAYPWVEPPIRIDYGTNVRIAEGVFINYNCTILDTCILTIGARTLIGPNVSLYAASHPLDPEVRNGTAGPEDGKDITIEEDCWICGNVVVLAGVRIGRGSTVGAGSVVTKSVAPYTIVAGNPARFIKEAPRGTKAEITSGALEALKMDQARQ